MAKVVGYWDALSGRILRHSHGVFLTRDEADSYMVGFLQGYDERMNECIAANENCPKLIPYTL